MKFKIKISLEKNALNLDNTMDEIKENIKKRANSFNVVNVKNGEPEVFGPTLYYKYKDKEEQIIVEIEFRFSGLNFEYVKAIYEIYTYLKQFSNEESLLKIEFEKVQASKNIKEENKEYKTVIEEHQTIIFEKHKGDRKEFNFTDFMSYIVEHYSNYYRDKEEFEKFLKYIENKEQYKEILENIENYDKKKIPVEFKRKLEITYKEKNIISVVSYENVEEFIKEVEQKKGIKILVLDEQIVQYKLINTDFSSTHLKKYILLDENKNLFFILEELYGNVDEIGGILYFSTEEIPDAEISEFILFADECRKKDREKK